MSICPQSHCTGCTACVQKCPQNCINMTQNAAGARIAVIDASRCIHCGICQKICPVNRPALFHTPRSAFAVYAKDAAIRAGSASGGAAYTLCSAVVRSGGVAYGAAFVSNLDVAHIRVDCEADLPRLQKSKYVHSYTDGIYQSVKRDLSRSKQVIFTGTPCQIAGLYAFLGESADNLITCDIVCHGTPERETFNRYIESELDPEQIAYLTFRDKNGWAITAYDRNNQPLKRMGLKNSLYYNGFMEGYIYRENCYTCPWAQKNRISDLTLGDFWGVGEQQPFAEDPKAALQKGLSVLLVNTDRGQALLDQVKPALICYERTVQEAVQKNGQLNHPSADSKSARRFRTLYSKKGAAYALLHCNEKKRRILALRKFMERRPACARLCKKIPVLKDKL